MQKSAKVIGVVLAMMLVATSVVWYAAIRGYNRGMLTVTVMQIGAVLIEAPSGRNVLINGGPDDSILQELGAALPFYEHSFDIVIASSLSPQEVGGLASVLQRYSTSVVVRSAARSSSPQAQAFAGAVSSAQQRGTRLLVAERGEIIDLGAGALVESFFPDRDASQMSASDGCLMFKLIFEQTSFFFACGSSAIETYEATLDGSKLKSEVLIAIGNEPELFAGFVSPQVAIVPCGATSTSFSFVKLQVQTTDACDHTVTFISDGQTVTHK